ncbi:RraA family protein [Curtobacterium flaccumfaciens pv. oortii]|uniref:RraA family protein n=1 Tax=Curtobacterium flaccumfaciens TaxID=2035 RepID=UPI002658C7C3|nr:RraA family protein [Curtobacterium flaccumfaciens]MCS5524645.1 RraA family protein [Curtobacterium flaccumfaciens pv. oortii]
MNHDDGGAASAHQACSSASVSDALDALGLQGSIVGLRQVADVDAVTGPAFTVRYEPVDEQGGTVGDFLDDVPPGSVIVIDNGGRTDCTVWGGIMTQAAQIRGIAGTIVHGACRDTLVCRTSGYPVWSTGQFMRTGKDRVRIAGVQEDLLVEGVCIRPGDLVVADADGVVVIPRDRAHEVLDRAIHIEDIEAAVAAAVHAGSTLRQAREDLGYHTLQQQRDA